MHTKLSGGRARIRTHVHPTPGPAVWASVLGSQNLRGQSSERQILEGGEAKEENGGKVPPTIRKDDRCAGERDCGPPNPFVIPTSSRRRMTFHLERVELKIKRDRSPVPLNQGLNS